MASTSNTSTQPDMEESATSTSASAGFQYNPPTTKLPFISEKKYHVFLSFRGEDIRTTFVDHLYQALSEADLQVFLDNEKLERGEILGLTFEKAIESSAIRIPIFSKGYADSVWCLKEATAMSMTPGLIIPVFYHVDPTDVRYPEKASSPYKQSFLKYYRHSDRCPREASEWWQRALQQICPWLKPYGYSVRYSGEEVDRWKNALLEICKRSGWTMDITGGYEARLVKTVVNDVIKRFDRVPLDVIKHAVGMESVKNSLIEKLGLNLVGEVVKVGIWGIGGIGKTTAAKAVYNQIYADFEAACFVFNVRDTGAGTTGLIQLQKKVLKDLSKYGGEVGSVDEGISLFKYHFKGKRVLLVLDDVDKKEKLNALIGDWKLAPGSRVIIASRDKQILNDARVLSERIHELSGLNVDEGLQLFKWHAFLGASPSHSLQVLSRRIVEACNGHPLSLEVIGSFLYGKDDISYWEEALQNIILHEGILERLEISYTTLSEEEKQIFVDIACYFIGEHKALPVAFWKSMKYKMVDTYLLNLSMKLLIKIGEKGVFDMHDLLRDMGRNIADRKHTRLWDIADPSAISDSTNFSHLRLNGGTPQRLEILCRPGLRYLHLENLRIEGMTENTLLMLPPSLIWLRLENCTFAFGEERRHHSIGGNSLQLKTMQIKFCSGVDGLSVSLATLFSLPNIQLQYLDFEGCEDLKSLPDAIGNLSQLQQLHLKKCRRLNNLPHTIGNLSKLQHLVLRRCSSFKNLPRTIGKLSQLQHLDMKRCDSLNNLPDLIGDLSQLQCLNLGRCRVLNSLPDTIEKLSQLRHLDLKMCYSLNTLPNTIGYLSRLQHLNLEKCVILKSLPSTIGNLLQLQYLNLKECVNLESLPDTIGNLSQLQHLDLEKCVNLDNLPYTFDNLSQLQYLKRPLYV